MKFTFTVSEMHATSLGKIQSELSIQPLHCIAKQWEKVYLPTIGEPKLSEKGLKIPWFPLGIPQRRGVGGGG